MADTLSIILKAKLDQASTSGSEINSQIKQLENKVNKLNIKLNVDSSNIASISKQLDSLKKYFQGSGSDNIPFLPNENIINDKVQRINNALDRLKVNKDKVFADSRVITEVDNLKKVEKAFISGTASAKQYSLAFDTLKTRVSQVQGSIRNVTHDGYDFVSMTTLAAKKIAIWGISTNLVYGSLNQIQKGLSTLKELDTLMIDIAKVTNISASEMENLKKSSFGAASEFGRTANDYLSGIAEFSRAGYEGQSENLSKLSLLLQNVGEVTSEQASQFLLATDAAYKYSGSQEKLSKVIDGANQIDNKFATSVSKISDGMTVAGSIASNAGVGVDELASAVGVMTAVTQKSGNEVGRAFRGILMNIRQIKGETEDGDVIDDETLSKSASALNDIGIKVHELRDGIEELRNPMDVLRDISKIWDNLSTIDQSKLTDAIGGKYRGNQFVSLVENFEMYDQMIQEYQNSSGSALAENEKRMAGWEQKANKFSNTVAKMWENTLSTDGIKNLIDFGTRVVELVDKVGLLTTAIGVLNIALIATGRMAKVNAGIVSFGNSIKNAATELKYFGAASEVASKQLYYYGSYSVIATKETVNSVTALRSSAVATKALALSVNVLKTALSTLWPFLVVSGITFIWEKFKEGKEQVEAIKSSLSDFNNTLNDFNDSLDSNKIQQLTNNLQSLKEASDFDNTTKRINDLKFAIANLGTPTDENSAMLLKSYNDELSELEGKIKPVIEAQDQYNQAVENSKKPFTEQNGLLVLNKTLLEELVSTKNKDCEATLNQVQVELEAQARGLQEKLRMYGVEIEAINSVAEARNASVSLNYGDSGISGRMANKYIGGIISQYDYIEGLKKKVNGSVDLPNNSPSKSGSGSSSASEPSFQDPTEAIIRSINAEATLTAKKAESLKYDISIAEKQKNYNAQLLKTQDLYTNQSTQLEQLQQANYKLMDMGDKMGMWSLIDSEGEKTVEYYQIYNSSSKEAQENLEAEVERLIKIRSAINDNTQKIYDLRSAQLDLADSFRQMATDYADKQIDSLKTELENITKGYEAQKKEVQSYYDDLIAEKQEELDATEDQIDAENRLAEIRNINNQISDTKKVTDKEYINQYGEVEFTYDKSAYNDLIKQREDLLKQYRQEDIKKAIEDEIKELEDRRDAEIAALDEEIEEAQNSYNERIENYELFKTTLETMQADELLKLQTSVAAKAIELNNYATAFEQMVERILAAQAKLASSGANSGDSPSASLTQAHTGGVIRDGGVDLPTFHTGGVNSDSNRVVQLVNKMFNLKSNETLVKALDNELFVPQENILNNFVPNLRSYANSLVGKVALSGTSTSSNVTYEFNNVTIKANDINQFIKSMNYKVQAQG